MPGEQRINIRASRETVDYLKRAAAVRKMSLTHFMLAVSTTVADRIFKESGTESDA
jgi:uncharacterized protein (DUF1778 family)